jgi:hypothetical protein
MQTHKSSAALAFFLTFPALALCLSGLLKFSVPLVLIHPVFVLGGLFAALLLSVYPILAARIGFENGALKSAVSIRVKDSLANLGVALLSLALLGVIALYLFVENFQPR